MIKKTVLFVMLLSMINLGFSVIEISGCTVINDTFLAGDNEVHLTADIIDSNISKCIDIQTDNLTFDCQGHLIDGDKSQKFGINIYRNSQETTNITVQNCKVSDWYESNIYSRFSNYNTYRNIITHNCSSGYYHDPSGIQLVDTGYNIIDNITSHSNTYGIKLYPYNNNNKIINSNFTNNNYGVALIYGCKDNVLENLSIKENTYRDLVIEADNSNKCFSQTFINVTGSDNGELGYFNSQVNLENRSFSELILCNADDSILNNITITGSQTYNNNGLYLLYTDRANLSNIISSNNYYGINLDESDYNNIKDTVTNDNQIMGIKLFYSNFNKFYRIISNYNSNYTTTAANAYGIALHGDNNVIENSSFNFNKYGVALGTNNKINNSFVSNNNEYGIASGDGSIITNNNLMDNLYDLGISACNIQFENNIGSGNRPIGFYNSSSIITNKVFSELLLCEANNSIVENVLIKGSDSVKNNALIIIRTYNSTINKIVSNSNYIGISIHASANNNISNSILTDNIDGIRLDDDFYTDSTNNSIFACNISGNDDYNINEVMYASDNNYIFNNYLGDSSKLNLPRSYYDKIINTYRIGNYWSDFVCTANETRGEFIVCTSPSRVTLDTWTYDNAPLVKWNMTDPPTIGSSPGSSNQGSGAPKSNIFPFTGIIGIVLATALTFIFLN